MKISKIFIISLVSIALFANSAVFAQYTFDSLRSEALENIDLAKEFSARGAELIRSNPTRDNLKIAAYMYSEAGKLYEKSLNAFKAIGDPNYARVCQESVQTCIKTVQKCHQKAMSVRR